MRIAAVCRAKGDHTKYQLFNFLKPTQFMCCWSKTYHTVYMTKCNVALLIT